MRLLVTLALCFSSLIAHADETRRIVSADGAVTEILVALGAGDELVGVDTTSQYPPDTIDPLPRVGYLRALPIEGVLSLKPTHLITTEEARPENTLSQAAAAGVQVVALPVARNPEEAISRIRNIGRIIGRAAEAETLVAAMSTQIERVLMAVEGRSGQRVLLLLAAGSHGVMLAGRHTSGDALLRSLGVSNASATVNGYKPASREGLLASKPDVIIVAEGRQGQFSAADWPELGQLTAWKQGHYLVADAMLLLGFGPRLGQAMETVADAIPHAER